MKLMYKLVRDKIPSIIRRTEDRRPEVRRYEDEQYVRALHKKLYEEAHEVWRAGPDRAKLISEMADLFEVVDALLKAYDIDTMTVNQAQRAKRKERGAYRRGYAIKSEDLRPDKRPKFHPPQPIESSLDGSALDDLVPTYAAIAAMNATPLTL